MLLCSTTRCGAERKHLPCLEELVAGHDVGGCDKLRWNVQQIHEAARNTAQTVLPAQFLCGQQPLQHITRHSTLPCLCGKMACMTWTRASRARKSKEGRLWLDLWTQGCNVQCSVMCSTMHRSMCRKLVCRTGCHKCLVLVRAWALGSGLM